MKNVIFCVLILFGWSLKQIEKLKSKHFENSEVMNEWMMHLYSALLYICSKVRGSGKEGRGSQGWRAKKGCLITQNKALNKRKHGSSSSGLSLSSSGLSRSVDVRICSLALDSRLAAGGALLNSLRQSLETDTGVNHHSLAHCFPARLRTRSPLSAFRLPTPPSPHTPTARLRPVSPPACSPPPPHSWRGSRLPPSVLPACGPPWT